MEEIKALKLSKQFNFYNFYFFFKFRNVFKNPSPNFWKGFFMLCDLATLDDLSSPPRPTVLDTLIPPPRPLKHNNFPVFFKITNNAHNFRCLLSSELQTVALSPRLEKCEPRSESEAEPEPEYNE